MVKRKTSCSNARMCSMLLTNVTRSASYEALPNHCLFPVRSGLTSRFPLRNRWLWVDRVGDRRCYAILARNSLMENWKASLNSVSTCLKVVDTRRTARMNTCAGSVQFNLMMFCSDGDSRLEPAARSSARESLIGHAPTRSNTMSYTQEQVNAEFAKLQ